MQYFAERNEDEGLEEALLQKVTLLDLNKQ